MSWHLGLYTPLHEIAFLQHTIYYWDIIDSDTQRILQYLDMRNFLGAGLIAADVFFLILGKIRGATEEGVGSRKRYQR